MISTARWGVTALNSVVMVWLGLSCQGLILASSALMVSASRVKASVVRSIRDRSAVGVLHTTLLSVTCPLLIRSHKSGLSRSSWRKFLSAGDVVQTRRRPLLQHLPLAPIGQDVAGTAHLRMQAALGLDEVDALHPLIHRQQVEALLPAPGPTDAGDHSARRLARVDPDTSGAH